MIGVIGDIPNIPLEHVRVSLEGDLPRASLSAIVFDLRAAAVAELIPRREQPALAGLPLLLISDIAIPESAISLLQADDTFTLGVAGTHALTRRLRILAELGRGRCQLVEQERFADERQRFERLAAMGTMVAGFAHEVRNPVAAMRSLCEELRDEGITLPHVGLLLQMVDRIERLVRTSLQFGRPAAPKRRPLRPAAITSWALSELHPRLRTAHEDIRVETDPELPDVFVDDRQIGQALVILLNNALDATSGKPSRVVLRVRRTPTPALVGPPTIRFEVIDDGPGISPANLGRIFDPFFTTKASGTGLGLSIAQQIVNENCARLEVESTPGGRTSFTIILPTDPSAEQRNDHGPSLFRS